MKTSLYFLAATLILALAADAQDTITVCSSSGSASGDPHFRGFRGQRFEFQGSAGNVYNLLTAPSTQLNARFLGNSKWGDSRTFMDAVSVQADGSRVSVGCVNSTLVAEANGQQLSISSPVVDKDITVVWKSSSSVFVSTELLDVSISKAKNRWASCFLNVDVVYYEHVENPEDVHGLIGQTVRFDETDTAAHTLSKYEDGRFAIEGLDSDYQVAGGHIFGNTFRFNRFRADSGSAGPRRSVLSSRRSLLVDCSSCSSPSNPCSGHPDGMENCGINDNTGDPECYGTDPLAFCAVSGCAVQCDTLVPAPAFSCGSFATQNECDSGFSTSDNAICVWDSAGCVATTEVCVGFNASHVVDETGGSVSCTVVGGTECNAYGTGNGGNQASCIADGPGLVCSCPSGSLYALVDNECSTPPFVDDDPFPNGYDDVTNVWTNTVLLDNGSGASGFANGNGGWYPFIYQDDATCEHDVRIANCVNIWSVSNDVTCSAFYDSAGTCEPGSFGECQGCTLGAACQCVP